MRSGPRLSILFIAFLISAFSCVAQQTNPPASPPNPYIYLDVVVTPKSGPPISGLQQQDFTILDNKAPAKINSFQPFTAGQVPLEAVIVVDDVNTGLQNVAYERTEINKFLQSNGGQLAMPTALAFFTDSGMQVQNSYSTDGKVLAEALKQHDIGLHSILRSGGIYSAVERFDLSLKALLQLMNFEGPRPGRKFIIWLSPGWPLLSSPSVDQQLSEKQREQIFSEVVRMSASMRNARITLYSIDPLGTADFGGRSFRWQAFEKGISKPSQAEGGDLSLQVLAVQSGGLALTTGNDLTAYLQQCVNDAQAFYEFSIVPPLDQKPNTYHHLEVRVSKSGAVARTRTGYYSEP